MNRRAFTLVMMCILVVTGCAPRKSATISPIPTQTLIGPDYAVATKQQSGSKRVGWSAVLIGRGVVAGPLYRRWEVITVETGPYRYQWEELREKGRLVFTINERFTFWRYKNLFLVVDSEGNTHKFQLVSAERIRP
jgi:hypothetical protein